MTVSFGQVRTWRPDLVADCARSLADRHRELERAWTALPPGPVAGGAWTGGAAAAAGLRQAELRTELEKGVDGFAVSSAAVRRAADQLTAIGRLVADAEQRAERYGLVITDDSQVHARAGSGWLADLVDPVASQAWSAVRDRLADELRTEVQRLLARAAEVDALLADALLGAAPTPALGIGRELGAGWSPAQQACWWSLLSDAQQDRLIGELPDGVGSSDGLPAWARDRANRTSLAQVEAGLLAAGGSVELLATVQALRTVLTQADGRTRQLVMLDLSGRVPTAAVSVGDVDQAGHVAVLVGGASTTVAGDIGRYDVRLAELTDLAQAQSGAHGDGRSVAGVVWLGYEAPQWGDLRDPDRSVLLPRAAQAGAPALGRFLAGLDAAGGAASSRHLTVLAHSYGSTVAGMALAGSPTGVDDLAVFGSPGLGVDDPAALGLPPGGLHVLEAGNDVVADLGRFGTDPDRLPGVDTLSTSSRPLPDGTVGARSSGHGQYLTAGTTSAWNLAAVAAGTPQLLVRQDRCADRPVILDLTCGWMTRHTGAA